MLTYFQQFRKAWQLCVMFKRKDNQQNSDNEKT